MSIEEINKEQLSKVIKDSKYPVVVDFYATWCGPCQAYKPIMERFADRAKDRCKVYKSDIDVNLELTNLYKIKSVPTTMVFYNNRPITQTTGILSERQLLELIDII